jgi:Fic/DOC family protein
VRAALAAIKDGSELLDFFLIDGKVTRAGRVAGALRAIGNVEAADNIITTMKAIGHDIRESNPFDEVPLKGATLERVHPIVWRLNAMWEKMREDVIKTFPEAPKRKKDIKQLLKDVEARYEADAYHSLSIEGYKVSAELIDRIATNDWTPETDSSDSNDKNALAASGYWKCFQEVKETISAILSNDGVNPGEQVQKDHRKWYLALFGPLVTAGVCDPRALAGYRRDRVIISESRHAPPNYEAVPDAMAALFTLLKQEKHPAVRVVLGHWMFGYIHPYMDGNGRMARFLMNVMLIAGSYDWLVIDVANRTEYMAALESASVDGNIVPFAEFLAP